MSNQQFTLGSIIDHGGAEYAVTARGYVNLTTGQFIQQFHPRCKVKLIRRPFGLEIKENN